MYSKHNGQLNTGCRFAISCCTIITKATIFLKLSMLCASLKFKSNS